MSLHQASLDGIVRLGGVKDKSDLITPELEQIVMNIIVRVLGPLRVISFKLVDPFLKELLKTRRTGVESEPGL